MPTPNLCLLNLAAPAADSPDPMILLTRLSALLRGSLLAAGAAAQGVAVTPLAPEFGASGGVAAGPGGRIYVVDFGVRLDTPTCLVAHRLTPEGAASTSTALPLRASGNALAR